MCCKIISSSLFVFFLISQVFAVNVYWDDGGAGELWSTANNWNPNQAPTNSDHALLDLSGSTTLIDSSVTAQCNMIWLGWNANPCYLKITGGSLNVQYPYGGGCLIGVSSGSYGKVAMSGGSFTTGSDMSIGQYSGSTGIFEMSGGTMTCGGWMYLPYQGNGTMYLLGGTVNAGGLYMTSQGRLDISKGSLVLNGDHRTTIQGYVDSPNGWIIAYNGSDRATVNYDYNVTHSGKTTVSASITAGNVEWNGQGSDTLWSSGMNWNIHSYPESGDHALINSSGADCVINNTVSAQCDQLWVGWTVNSASLEITGGSLNVGNTGSAMLVGVSSGSQGYLTVSGGTSNIAGDMSIGQLSGSYGDMEMTGGQFTVAGALYLPSAGSGVLSLAGGTLNCGSLSMTAAGSLDICGGTLILGGDARSTIDAYVANGWITAYGGNVRANIEYDYNIINPGKTTVYATIQDLGKAWNPSPAIDRKAATNVTLSWTAGDWALRHNVYLGTTFTEVDNADTGSPVCKSVEQQGTTYNPGGLSTSKMYYWRIDEVNSGNPLSPWKGNVWRFFTGPLAVSPDKTTVSQYEPIFIDIGTSAVYSSNPFNPDDIKVDLRITCPDAAQLTVPCFYLSGQSGDSMWQGRFAPKQTGQYSYYVQVYIGGSLNQTSSTFYFTSTSSSEDGFVKPNAGSYYNFRFDSGKRFRGIGENVTCSLPGYSFEQMFDGLESYGCNFARVWIAGPYDDELEWSDLGLGVYNQQTATDIDNAIMSAKNHGIYVMLCFDNFYNISTQDEARWYDNPYNDDNGGMCATVSDFFTNSSTKAQYKKKLRYIVARWGYSSNIAMWEFWNEVNAAHAFEGVSEAAITNWHNEMSTYLKGIDPFDHLVTSSISCTQISGLWSVSDLDFSQAHDYDNQTELDDIYSRIVSYENSYSKPHVVGEFSYVSTEPRVENPATMEKELHMGLWRGMFSPTPILPLTWWWDYHKFEGHDYHLQHAATFYKEMMTNNDDVITNLSVTAPATVEKMGVKAGKDRFVWVRNKQAYTISNVSISMSSVTNDVYTIQYYNTWTGSYYGSQNVTVSNGTLQFTISSMTAGQDLAIWIYPTAYENGYESYTVGLVNPGYGSQTPLGVYYDGYVGAGGSYGVTNSQYYQGSKSLQLNFKTHYEYGAWWAALMLNLGDSYDGTNPTYADDWSYYNKLEFWYKGNSNNPQQDLEIDIDCAANGGSCYRIQLSDPSGPMSRSTVWRKATVDLSSIPDSDLAHVYFIRYLVQDWNNNYGSSGDGSGTIYMDNFKLVK